MIFYPLNFLSNLARHRNGSTIYSFTDNITVEYVSITGMFKLQFWQLKCSQNLPILATDNICQFWQLWSLQNFQFWQLMILATFVSSRLPILATDNVRQFWQLMILANFGNFGQEPPSHCFRNVSETIPCPTLIPCLCFLYPPSFRRIKNAIIGNQTKKSSFMLLGVIPRLVE